MKNFMMSVMIRFRPNFKTRGQRAERVIKAVLRHKKENHHTFNMPKCHKLSKGLLYVWRKSCSEMTDV